MSPGRMLLLAWRTATSIVPQERAAFSGGQIRSVPMVYSPPSSPGRRRRIQ